MIITVIVALNVLVGLGITLGGLYLSRPQEPEPRTILDIYLTYPEVTMPFKVKKIANDSTDTMYDQFPIGTILTIVALVDGLDGWQIVETYIDDTKKLYVKDSKSWQLIK